MCRYVQNIYMQHYAQPIIMCYWITAIVLIALCECMLSTMTALSAPQSILSSPSPLLQDKCITASALPAFWTIFDQTLKGDLTKRLIVHPTIKALYSARLDPSGRAKNCSYCKRSYFRFVLVLILYFICSNCHDTVNTHDRHWQHSEYIYALAKRSTIGLLTLSGTWTSRLQSMLHRQ